MAPRIRPNLEGQIRPAGTPPDGDPCACRGLGAGGGDTQRGRARREDEAAGGERSGIQADERRETPRGAGDRQGSHAGTPTSKATLREPTGSGVLALGATRGPAGPAAARAAGTLAHRRWCARHGAHRHRRERPERFRPRSADVDQAWPVFGQTSGPSWAEFGPTSGRLRPTLGRGRQHRAKVGQIRAESDQSRVAPEQKNVDWIRRQRCPVLDRPWAMCDPGRGRIRRREGCTPKTSRAPKRFAACAL